MEFSGRISRVERDLLSKDYLITFSTKELPNSVQSLNREDYLSIKAVKKRKKRSLDANAYAWLIIGKLADAMRMSKEELYKDKLFEHGQSERILVRADVDVEHFYPYTRYKSTTWKKDEKSNEYEKYHEYLFARGTSSYDTREMSIFIDGIVEDAKEQGIDTIPRVDLEKMKAKWHL